MRKASFVPGASLADPEKVLWKSWWPSPAMERVRSGAEPRFSEIRFPLLVGVRSRVRSLFPKVLRVIIPRSELL